MFFLFFVFFWKVGQSETGLLEVLLPCSSFKEKKKWGFKVVNLGELDREVTACLKYSFVFC